MVRRALGWVFGGIVLVGVLLGLVRWHEAGTDGGPLQAIETVVNAIANAVASFFPWLFSVIFG